MQKIETTPQENFPLVMFDTHVFQDRVIFTLPVRATMETLVPLAKELLRLPDARNMEANIEIGESGALVISIRGTSD